ncbi:phage tail spike protein [Bacillus hominis]|uniref:Peptidase S74 n=1 Tax=Bacillus mycoides TaxID=1405 RepID=A0A1S9T7C3_BACMY|nr:MULTISPECIES: phage tail spike protein [Bacillus cereus group]MDM5195456.1 phage tail spike protein [Bacillus hominis]OOR05812.1 peptidase S74 [Bacillus mycoides]
MRTPSGNLHVVDFKTSQIVSVIQPKDYWDDKRHWEIKNNIDTLEFKVFENTDHASTLVQQNLVLKEVRGGRIVPYVITEAEKDSDDRSLMVYASGEWIQLAKAGIIEPQKMESKTLKQCMEIALKGTKWEIGKTEHDGAHSIVIEEFIDPLNLLKKIAASFELEIQYRAEVRGSQIVGRYVDMVKKRGRDTRKEVTFGKDLIGIKRIENSQNICTALLGYVQKENGEFITISEINNGVPYLVDDAAFQRWNENGKHKFAFYTPQTEDQDMSPERLLTLMKTEMGKLVNTSVSYEVQAQSIGQVFGLAHELINEGDTIRIIDTGFTPKLYLEARAIAGDESFKDPTQDKYVFGDYREIIDSSEELRKMYQKMLSMIQDKVSKEWFDALEEKVTESNNKVDTAVEESQAAKDLANATKDYMDQNMVDIIDSVDSPNANLKPNKTLWRDISGGRPGILKIWTGTIWETVVPDVEEVKRELELTNDKLLSKISGKQMEDYIGGLGSTNIFINSAFEDREINASTGIITNRTPSIKKWTPNATGANKTITAESEKNHDGYNSCKLSATGLSANNWMTVSQTIPVTGGSGSYVLSAWFYADDLESLDQGCYLEIGFFNGTTRVINKITEAKPLMTAGSWKFISVVLDAPSSGITSIKGYITLRRNGTIWVSQPQLQQGANPSTFMENPKDMGNYEQMIDEIAKKVATSEYNQKVTTMQTAIDQNTKSIELKAVKEEVYTKEQANGVFGDKATVERHEASIKTQAEQIDLRVQKGDIASTINQTAQSVLIQAGKIYLDGFIEAKHLKAQELVGVTIKTAPNGQQRYVKLNQQNIELYDKDTVRAEFRFFNKSDGTAINPTLTLGRSVSGGIVGALNLTQWTPINAQGVDNYQNAQATIGMVEQYNSNSNEFTYGSRINFFQGGAMDLKANDNLIINASQKGYIWLKTDSIGTNTDIFIEPSKDFKVTAGNNTVINSKGYFDSTSESGRHYFGKKDKPSTQNHMQLYDNNSDADLSLAFLRLRASHVTGYTSGFQIKNATGDEFRDLEARNIKCVSLQQTSTRLIKTGIKDVEISPLEKIMGLKTQQYYFKSDMDKLYKMREDRVEGDPLPTIADIPLQYGFIAEDSDIVFTTDDKTAINLYPVVALTVDSVQHIKLTQDEHGTRITKLEVELEVQKLEKVEQDKRIVALEELVQKMINGAPTTENTTQTEQP